MLETYVFKKYASYLRKEEWHIVSSYKGENSRHHNYAARYERTWRMAVQVQLILEECKTFLPPRRFTHRQRKELLLLKHNARSKPKLTILAIFAVLVKYVLYKSHLIQ
jgi:hypothetical protein